ncbi:MAG: Large ribosomal RNA subunit accumulation protein YceD [Porticoccaceae bacterium UBA1117]|nr:MAG: Large ribosomal RNA subunit accumulation protein YceD [Porticoccaceae bacterium UBA1117]
MLCLSCAAKRDRPYFMALPTHIDPRKLALQGYLLEGEVKTESLPRLASSVSAICSPLRASVQFELDESRAKVAHGTADVATDVICQRCLDTVQIELHAEFAVQVIWSEDHLHRVASNYEPWLVVDRMASLSELLEDEILLALPLVNYHVVGECTGDAFLDVAAPEADGTIEDSPFSILEQLKKKQ